MTFAWRRVQGA